MRFFAELLKRAKLADEEAIETATVNVDAKDRHGLQPHTCLSGTLLWLSCRP